MYFVVAIAAQRDHVLLYVKGNIESLEELQGNQMMGFCVRKPIAFLDKRQMGSVNFA